MAGLQTNNARISFCYSITSKKYLLPSHSALKLHLIRDLSSHSHPIWDLLRPNLFSDTVKQWSTIHEFPIMNE